MNISLALDTSIPFRTNIDGELRIVAAKLDYASRHSTAPQNTPKTQLSHSPSPSYPADQITPPASSPLSSSSSSATFSAISSSSLSLSPHISPSPAPAQEEHQTSASFIAHALSWLTSSLTPWFTPAEAFYAYTYRYLSVDHSLLYPHIKPAIAAVHQRLFLRDEVVDVGNNGNPQMEVEVLPNDSNVRPGDALEIEAQCNNEGDVAQGDEWQRIRSSNESGRWASPNLVTLFGVLCVVLQAITSFIATEYCFQGYASGEFSLALRAAFAAIGIFQGLYFMFDALDGMQGRRVGTYAELWCCPTTELFDHALDSFATTSMCIALIPALGIFLPEKLQILSSQWDVFLRNSGIMLPQLSFGMSLGSFFPSSPFSGAFVAPVLVWMTAFSSLITFALATWENAVLKKMTFPGGLSNPTEANASVVCFFFILAAFPDLHFWTLSDWFAIFSKLSSVLLDVVPLPQPPWQDLVSPPETLVMSSAALAYDWSIYTWLHSVSPTARRVLPPFLMFIQSIPVIYVALFLFFCGTLFTIMSSIRDVYHRLKFYNREHFIDEQLRGVLTVIREANPSEIVNSAGGEEHSASSAFVICTCSLLALYGPLTSACAQCRGKETGRRDILDKNRKMTALCVGESHDMKVDDGEILHNVNGMMKGKHNHIEKDGSSEESNDNAICTPQTQTLFSNSLLRSDDMHEKRLGSASADGVSVMGKGSALNGHIIPTDKHEDSDMARNHVNLSSFACVIHHPRFQHYQTQDNPSPLLQLMSLQNHPTLRQQKMQFPLAVRSLIPLFIAFLLSGVYITTLPISYVFAHPRLVIASIAAPFLTHVLIFILAEITHSAPKSRVAWFTTLLPLSLLAASILISPRVNARQDLLSQHPEHVQASEFSSHMQFSEQTYLPPFAMRAHQAWKQTHPQGSQPLSGTEQDSFSSTLDPEHELMQNLALPSTPRDLNRHMSVWPITNVYRAFSEQPLVLLHSAVASLTALEFALFLYLFTRICLELCHILGIQHPFEIPPRAYATLIARHTSQSRLYLRACYEVLLRDRDLMPRNQAAGVARDSFDAHIYESEATPSDRKHDANAEDEGNGIAMDSRLRVPPQDGDMESSTASPELLHQGISDVSVQEEREDQASCAPEQSMEDGASVTPAQEPTSAPRENEQNTLPLTSSALKCADGGSTMRNEANVTPQPWQEHIRRAQRVVEKWEENWIQALQQKRS